MKHAVSVGGRAVEWQIGCDSDGTLRLRVAESGPERAHGVTVLVTWWGLQVWQLMPVAAQHSHAFCELVQRVRQLRRALEERPRGPDGRSLRRELERQR
jgi:hypothetical protein